MVLLKVLQFSKTDYNDDDVEVGRCISRKINIQCSSSLESQRYFVFDYAGASLNPVTLWTEPALQRVITVHPVKNPDNMMSLHHFYKTLEFEEAYEDIHRTADFLNKLCKQLPPHVSPPLSVSAGCNLKLHPNLALFNASSKLNLEGAAPSGFLLHRNKIPFFLKPVDKFDLQPWTRFNDSLVQEMGSTSAAPESSPQGSLRAEVVHALGMLRPYIKSQHAPHDVKIKHILDGYIRFNPHLGREYILHLKLVTEKKAIVYRRYHMIREIGPQVAVVDLPAVPPKVCINIILPLGRVDSDFLEFLQSLGHVGLQYADNALHLVVVIFKEEHESLVEETLEAFSFDTFPISVSIAVHHGSGRYNNLKGFDIGVATLEREESLSFLADVGVRFAPGFFRRCRSNAELGRQVYYPAPFWLYQSSYKNFSGGSVPHIAAWTGHWAYYDFRMVCIFKKDYNSVGGYRERRYSMELLEAIIASPLDVMRAPEPGLFKAWKEKEPEAGPLRFGSEKGCRTLGSPKRRNICFDMKRVGQFEQTELADYLGELASRKGDFMQSNKYLF